MSKENLSKEALTLAQKIAHEVWEKYDDQHGYRAEKQKRNAEVSVEHPDNIWFFWNQFDPINQNEFRQRLTEQNASKEQAELLVWLLGYSGT